jgi:hypothetical protein
MTTVNQSELQTAVSVDELLALGSNPTLSDLLFYVRDGSQASENGKHRKVAGDVLRTLLAPLLKTVNSESLFGSGNIAISAGSSVWPALDSTLQTGNFNFGSSSRVVPISLAAGNIVGTLPASPADGQICGVVAQGVSGGSANRFTLGLNGKTRDGAGSALATSSAIPTNPSPASLVGLTTQLGVTGVFTSVNYQSNGGFENGHCLYASNSTPGVSWFELATSFGANGYFQFRTRVGYVDGGPIIDTPFLQSQVLVNGSAVSPQTIGTRQQDSRGELYDVIRIGVPQGAVTMRITRPGPNSFESFVVENRIATPPSSWTDVASVNVGPGGAAAWQWSNASQTWHTLFRRQLG